MPLGELSGRGFDSRHLHLKWAAPSNRRGGCFLVSVWFDEKLMGSGSQTASHNLLLPRIWSILRGEEFVRLHSKRVGKMSTRRPRVVFLGTPEFSVPSLEALAKTGQYEIVCVITQPDRPAGRGRKPRPSPVRQAAERLGLPVWTPENLRSPEAVERLRQLAPDVGVVVAYGEILRPNVLAIPPRGFVNVHASLLPKYRGASPVQAAILAGDRETGVTIMLMDAGMDTGPILAQRRIPIAEDETGASLAEKLARLGAELLVETLPRWLAGEIEPQPQDDAQASKTWRLKKEDGRVDWTRPAEFLARQVRAYTPWPGTFTTWDGKLLKIRRAHAVQRPLEGAQPGEVRSLPEGLAVATGDGWLVLDEVQLEGRKAVSGEAFLRGHPQIVGARLGEKGER